MNFPSPFRLHTKAQNIWKKTYRIYIIFLKKALILSPKWNVVNEEQELIKTLSVAKQQTNSLTGLETLGWRLRRNAITMIRVFMAYKATDDYVEMEPQELSAPERGGFTVIEWGGTEVK